MNKHAIACSCVVAATLAWVTWSEAAAASTDDLGWLWEVDALAPDALLPAADLPRVGPLLSGSPYDLNNDEMVNLADFAEFLACLSGAGRRIALGCEKADFDGDHDVDQSDFGGLQACYYVGSPPIPPCPCSPRISGGSYIRYILELGGQNHAADWKSGLRTAYTRGSSQDGQCFRPGAFLNYAVLVEVGGVHSFPGHPSNGFEVFGAANLVFSLELHEGSADGPLATCAVFRSTINDGTGTDPVCPAAFALSYVFTGFPGRLIDTVTNGGPRMEPAFLYPTCPPSTGMLVGMGAGYKEWICTGSANLLTMPGVGMCQMPDGQGGRGPGLCVVPVAEGQIGMSSCQLGTYVLEVIPGEGNNVLRGDINMLAATNRQEFAVAVNETVGDTITFLTAPCSWPGVKGRYVFYNNSAWDGYTPGIEPADFDAIAPDKIPLRPGGGTATPANYISFEKSINGIIVDATSFNRVPIVGEDLFFLLGNAETDPFSWTETPPDPDHVQLFPGAGNDGSDRLVMTWPDNAIPNSRWLLVALFAGDGSLGLTTDDYFMFGIAKGECTGDFVVSASDEYACRGNRRTPFNPATSGNLYDFNRDKLVDPVDELLPRVNPTTPLTKLKMISW